MIKISAQSVNKHYYTPEGRKLDVLANVSLDVAAGEFLCLLGPSGCGKTTLMNLMAGFEKADSGIVAIDGSPVTQPNAMHITIFQEYALFPWRTVMGNVLFGLEAKGIKGTEAEGIAREYLELVGLTKFAGSFPQQLSGGMKQRVSIARALAVEPDILFMDEPFAALDAFTRQRLQDELIRIWLKKRPTIIFVTHDIDEAVYLGERVAIMSVNPGRIIQVISVDLPKPCDRNSEAFLQIRRNVYQKFEDTHADNSYGYAEIAEKV